ncbi:hypothetical protein RBWH47_05628 [Rhodopirellula baltica WH47]|uniref:Uncharacterized protein n=1 Tax=Rhodopirellula baltica WH47 TaxID=991778 RepID=F2ATJ8_RHOBT|nr:hypothetical protein RBWH47_05628 [Rhodopirellula baltica WH47]
MSKTLQRAARDIGLVLVLESISGLPDCGGRDRFHLVVRMRIDRIATPWTSCWVTIRFPVSE